MLNTDEVFIFDSMSWL